MSARSGEASKKYRRIADDELIERRAAGNQHGGRSTRAAAGAPGSLPRRGDRARIAGQHRHVQSADVHTELESIG